MPSPLTNDLDVQALHKGIIVGVSKGKILYATSRCIIKSVDLTRPLSMFSHQEYREL
jgi:hypothetical protein